MAGTGRHLRSDAPIVTHAEVESSLRRQFVVPAMGVLPSAMVATGLASAAASQGSSWMSDALRIDFRLTGSLRQAAGLLLATSLWTAAGYLFFQHMDSPARVVSATDGVDYADIDPRTPLGYLVQEYSGDVWLPPAFEVTDATVREQDRLWEQLEAELVELRGAEISPHIRQLRKNQEIELLKVDGGTFAAEGLLLVSARLEGVVSVALMEPSQALVAPQDFRPLMSPRTSSTQLFLSRFPGGFGYETVVGGRPVLLQALLPDTQVESAIHLRPIRQGAGNVEAPQRPS